MGKIRQDSVGECGEKVTLAEALAIVKAAGYRVTMPRKVKLGIGQEFNSLGLRCNAVFDPNYKRKMSLTSPARLSRYSSSWSPAWKEDTAPTSKLTRFDMCFRD